jgi:uncharacterized protein YcsI (UPF0317 family)
MTVHDNPAPYHSTPEALPVTDRSALATDSLTPAQLRARIRAGDYRGNTSGLAPGHVQCNLVILPAAHAGDFLRFCQANPRPCPLIACSAEPGATGLARLGDLDLRSDLPAYRVFRDGALSEEVHDITALWQDDFMAFALGCSFSFEEALLAAGLEVRNVSEGVNVPMYRSNLPCEGAGVFDGDMVVSMRPFPPAAAIRAIQVCSRFPAVHGAPCISATRRRSASAICRSRTSAMRSRSTRARSPVLGLRRDATGRPGGGIPAPGHHPRAGLHAGDGPAQRRAGNFLGLGSMTHAAQLRPRRELRELAHGHGRRGHAVHRPGEHCLRLSTAAIR